MLGCGAEDAWSKGCSAPQGRSSWHHGSALMGRGSSVLLAASRNAAAHKFRPGKKLLEGLLCHPLRAGGVQADGALSLGAARELCGSISTLQQSQDHPSLAKPSFAEFAACILAEGTDITVQGAKAGRGDQALPEPWASGVGELSSRLSRALPLQPLHTCLHLPLAPAPG